MKIGLEAGTISVRLAAKFYVRIVVTHCTLPKIRNFNFWLYTRPLSFMGPCEVGTSFLGIATVTIRNGHEILR